MKIVAISDTHCHDLTKLDLPEGDVLIHAGDALSQGTLKEFKKFVKQMNKLDYKYKIYVPGNHDRITEENERLVKDICNQNGIVYLRDDWFRIEGKIKVYGSPVTPRFHDWAWNRDSAIGVGTSVTKEFGKYKDIRDHWDLIPEDVDILITHGPPWMILDKSVYTEDNVGCPYLLKTIKEINPKYHIFGHIHAWGGRVQERKETTFINASVCNEAYKPTNKIISFDIDYNPED